MPDPDKTINPETGRPIGDDRVSPFDTRQPLSDGEIALADGDGVVREREPVLGAPRPRSRKGTFVVIDINEEEDPVAAIVEALLGE